MSSRTYRGGAGRSIRGSNQGTTQNRNPQGGFQGGRGNPARQFQSVKPKIDATFLREHSFIVAKPIQEIMEHFNAIIRIDIGPDGGSIPVILPNPQLGNPNSPVPTLSDLRKLFAIASFINDAKKESVSSDTRNQAMADAFRVYMGIPEATRNRMTTSMSNNELALIATTVTSIALIEENKKTISSNTITEGLIKNLLISDAVRIKNASFRHLVAILQGENLKDLPIRKRSNNAGVCEFMFTLLTKKIVAKSSDDLIHVLFPRNDFLRGFSLTFSEIRDTEKTYVEKYSALTKDSAVLIRLYRDDRLMRAINFLSEDFSFTRESETLVRMNRQAVVMIPPYNLKEVATLISNKKTGVYDGRWANLPNSLNPVSGIIALSHAALRFKLLQATVDISFLLDDLFSLGDEFRRCLREKPNGEEFNVGTWILKNIVEDDNVDEDLYDDLFSELATESTIVYLERFLTSQLGFLEDHRFTMVLRQILSLERSGADIRLVRRDETTTITIPASDKTPASTREEVTTRVVYPNSCHIGRPNTDIDGSSADRDLCAEVKIGSPSTGDPEPTSADGVFRKKFFSDASTVKKVERRGADPGGSTPLSPVSINFLKELYRKNKAVATGLNNYIRGFSNIETQNYVIRILRARENQILGIDPMSDILTIAPEYDDELAQDIFEGMDDN